MSKHRYFILACLVAFAVGFIAIVVFAEAQGRVEISQQEGE